MSLHSKCLDAHNTVETFLNNNDNDDLVLRTQDRVRESMDILRQALDEYKLDEIALSYNGGKDCLVMLVLYLAVLFEKLQPQELNSYGHLNTVLVNYEEQFPELVTFISESLARYNLRLAEYNTSLKDGLGRYLEANPKVKAIVVGTRYTDPYAADLTPFQRTDSDWPDFVRIHPVLRWRYDEIWCFLRTTHTKYCSLYDSGYTSLGGTNTTVQNPNLKTHGTFKPAYELEQGDVLEREGRNRK